MCISRCIQHKLFGIIIAIYIVDHVFDLCIQVYVYLIGTRATQTLQYQTDEVRAESKNVTSSTGVDYSC